MGKIKLNKKLDECYEEILIGFILELKNQNVEGREIGRQLAKIVEFMEVWDA